jgi:hypothetical protein
MHIKHPLFTMIFLVGGMILADEVKTKTVVKKNGKTVERKVVKTKTAFSPSQLRSRRTYYYSYPSRTYTYYRYDRYSPRCNSRCRQRCRKFCRYNTRLSVAACRHRCRNICFNRCG